MARSGAPALAPLDGVFLASLGVRATYRASDETSRVIDLPVRWRGGFGRGPVRWDRNAARLSASARIFYVVGYDKFSDVTDVGAMWLRL